MTGFDSQIVYHRVQSLNYADTLSAGWYNSGTRYDRLAQWRERFCDMEEVMGSNPILIMTLRKWVIRFTFGQ